MQMLTSIASLRDVRDGERFISKREIPLQELAVLLLNGIVFEKMFTPVNGPSLEVAQMIANEGYSLTRLYYQIKLLPALNGVMNAIEQLDIFKVQFQRCGLGLIQSIALDIGDGELAQELGLEQGFIITRDDAINLIYDADKLRDVTVALEQEDDSKDLLDALTEICDKNEEAWYRADYLLLECQSDNATLYQVKELT